MSINSINYGSSLLGQAVRSINDKLSDLSTQLATGVKAPNYAGMGIDEGFAIAARSQLSNIDAFTTTISHVNTIIQAANTGLQSLQKIHDNVQSAASTTPQNLTSTGQSVGQQAAFSNLSAIVGILNTQVGDRYIFSGSAINQPAMASADDILNGTATQAGLKQVISERKQADLGTSGMGRLVLSSPTTTPLSLSEDVAGSPFGLKLNSVTSSLTNAAVSGPSGSPPSVSVDLSGGNPNPGDQINFTFNLPDGTTESIQLTASNATPAAVTGSVVNNQQATPARITGATALSGAAGTNSIGSSFSAGDTITVNGQTITFVASGASGNNQINVTDSVNTLLGKIDALSGTSTPSTISGGVISLRSDTGSGLSVSSSNTAAFAALGFSGRQASTFAIGATPAETTANLQSALDNAIGTLANTALVAASAVKAGDNFFDTPPLRVSGSPLGSATALANGSASTVGWYTGSSGSGSARSTASVQIDTSQSVQFGAQANEVAIRTIVQQTAVYAAVSTSPTNAYSGAQVAALSQRIAANLTPQPAQQTISDIQTDFANAQVTMKDTGARQTQAKAALQSMVDQTEGISQNEVAAQILQLQTNLQASYQTTSMLSQLSLVKYL